MGSPGPAPDVTLEDALRVFTQSQQPSTPLTATEVANELACTRRTAHRKLEELAERGELETKKTGARSRIWWRPPTDTAQTSTERQLNEILDRMTGVFTALDTDWRITHLNEASRRAIVAPLEEDLSKDALVGRRLWEINPNTTSADVQETELYRSCHEAMERQEMISYERYYEDEDLWVYTRVYPSETGVSIFSQDITERKDYERELEESKRRYRTLVENFPNGAVALVDEDLHYITFGGTPEGEADVTRADLEGEPLHEALPQKLAEIVVPHYEAALDGDTSTFERTIDGRDYQFRFIPVRDGDGNVFTAIGMSQEVTERREYERALEASNERLEQFASAVSHDLQEPLRMVSSYLQLLEGRYADALDEDGEEFLAFAVDGAERMKTMIDGLLEYSRVETQGEPLEPVDLGSVLADVRDDLQFQIEETDAEIRSEPLPTVEGDPNQLRQLFQNLLSNAITYSGDEPPRVEISASRDGDWVISVSDEGIGIDPEKQEVVFDVFQRLHTHDEYEGTGIGLALCKRIVERHDGEIRVDSDPGEGTTFFVTLSAATDRER
ncbi:sensor histidine kinase [Natronoglomus mannanivorans]|uniref:histidine kinase n=1 Tax=Natronoglomus mannanivorans TaxID=2979990 RepID=A0AAP2Z254_9EURY|nr:ATP-binding protein [Halobacteria archaeon AArc-xg1-1]